jgi:UDPglucose 6-dehydrogenase
MDISIHGTGYVGLVTGACIADAGNNVLCVDIDAQKIAMLQDGQIPIYEPGLESIVRRNIANGRLKFTTDIEQGVAFGIVQFIAVGTPPGEDGSADMQYVIAVARSIGAAMNDYRVVVNKSTVPVGTADKVHEIIQSQLTSRGVSCDFDVVSNPEFLKEGAAVNDFIKPDRIIVGTNSERAAGYMRRLYAPFNRNRDRFMRLDTRSAELTKYAANAMLATKISFMNELANLAERVGADIEQVRIGIGSDPRIGYEFIYPGCGFGGSCFPKDVRALVNTAAEFGYRAELIEAVQSVNDEQKYVLFKKLHAHFGGQLQGRVIALWGLAFKPNTDDMREAPSLTFIDSCLKAGIQIRAYDPIALDATEKLYGKRNDLVLCGSAEDALKGADALVVVTEWREFRTPDFGRIAELLSDAVVFDGRNIYDPKQMSELGFRYYAIGRGDPLRAVRTG